MDTTISDRVVEQLKVLPQHLQWRVLEFARALVVSTPKGLPGKEAARLAGGITPEDAGLMRAAIEETCENVEEDGW
jgi:hypothetical protein